jgi:hypothetical protein
MPMAWQISEDLLEVREAQPARDDRYAMDSSSLAFQPANLGEQGTQRS